VDPPSLPSAFVEYPPDLMDSHATDQCHDNTPAIAENSFATPVGSSMPFPGVVGARTMGNGSEGKE
jgi:hypothetical protein